MKYLYAISHLILLNFSSIFSQVIWEEDFSTFTNVTTGSDTYAPAGADWTATCPYSIAATDYLRVVSGRMEGRDTNGPAVWETQTFDVSSCTYGFTISVDLSESGDHESCSECNTNKYNCFDFIRVEYNLDGGGYTTIMSPGGENCLSSTTTWGDGGYYNATGNFTSRTVTSGCLFGSSLSLRITIQNWAGGEYMRFDNVAVTCVGSGSSCALPIELLTFEAENQEDKLLLNWSTISELNNDYFTIERSVDGKLFEEITTVEGAGTTEVPSYYQAFDNNPVNGIAYYRLKQTDYDGKWSYSSTIEITRLEKNTVKVVPNPISGDKVWQIESKENVTSAQIYDLNGKVIFNKQGSTEEINFLLSNLNDVPKGIFYLVLGFENGQSQHQKIVKN